MTSHVILQKSTVLKSFTETTPFVLLARWATKELLASYPALQDLQLEDLQEESVLRIAQGHIHEHCKHPDDPWALSVLVSTDPIRGVRAVCRARGYTLKAVADAQVRVHFAQVEGPSIRASGKGALSFMALNEQQLLQDLHTGLYTFLTEHQPSLEQLEPVRAWKRNIDLGHFRAAHMLFETPALPGLIGIEITELNVRDVNLPQALPS